MRIGSIALLALGALLAACSTPARREAPPPPREAGANRPPTTAQGAPQSPRPVPPGRGGYYQDDGPGDNSPPNLEATPDAVPVDEPPLRTAANRPYVVFGRTYTPLPGDAPFRQRGTGSWYGRKFHGQKTSSGEPYDMYAMTAAHPTLPLPSYVRVTNLATGRSVIVKVNDRGPFHSDRIIDLSYTAAYKLGYAQQGSTQVEIERVRAGAVVAPEAVAAVARPQVRVAQPPFASPPTASKPPAATPPVASQPAASQPALASAPEVRAAAGDVAATPASAVLQTSTQPDGLYLQLGAFGAREGAEEFRIKAYQQLPWLTETMYIVARDQLHRVQLGPFPDRSAAQGIADRIREALQFKPVFVLK